MADEPSAAEAAPAEGTAAAAQAALAETATPPSLLSDTAPGAAEEKPAEEAKPEEKSGFDVEKLVVPEGATVDKEVLAEFGTIAKELGIDQGGAQRLFDLHAKLAKANSEANTRAWNDLHKTWVSEVEADKELGGANLTEVKATVSKVLNDPRFGDPKIREALDLTGAGNHPALVRTLYRMAKALTEGGSVTGNPPTKQAPRSAAQALYPNLPTGA